MKILISFVLIFSLNVYADTTLIMKTIATDDENEINIKNGELRFVIKKAGQVKRLSLYSNKEQKLVFISEKNNSFFVLDKKVLAMQKAYSQQKMKLMAQQLKKNLYKLPPEKRKKAELFLANIDNDKAILNQPIIEIEATGNYAEVGGFACERVEVYIDKELDKELCLADAKALKMDKYDFETLKNFFAFMKTITGVEKNNNIPDLKGIPIATKDLKGEASSGLQSISYKKLNEDLFKVPANYQQVYIK